MLDKLLQPLFKLLGERTIAIIGVVATDVQQNEFYKAKLQTCIEVSEAVATLASSRDPATLTKAGEEFWKFYYGPLILFEDNNVEKAMRAYGDKLKTLRNGGDLSELQPHALRISAACHDLISLGLLTQLKTRLFPTEKKHNF